MNQLRQRTTAPPSKKTWNIPFGSALKESVLHGYSWHRLQKDIIAGLTVGVIALPLAMALAIASGVAPQYGLYTAVVAGVVVSLSGGSRVNISGPTAAFVVILLPIQAQFGMGGLAMATFMAGLIISGFGLARMGSFIQLIPYPVVIGFTSGIGVVIAVLQVQNFLGLKVALTGSFLSKLSILVAAMPGFNGADLVIGVLTLASILTIQRLNPKIPHYLFALLVGSGVAAWWTWADAGVNISTIGKSFSYQIGEITGQGIPPILPRLQWPWQLGGAGGQEISLTMDLISALIGPAFTIAALGGIESLLSAVVADGLAGTKHDPNAELMGLGLGNLLVPFVGCLPATAAIARTAANIRAGATSPIAAVVHGFFVLGAILVLAPSLSYVPMSTLAAMLFVVAWNMSEAHHFVRLLKVAPKSDVAVLLTCFSLTVLFDMVVAIMIGVFLAGVLFIKRMTELSGSVILSDEDLKHMEDFPKGTLLYQVNGPMFFGAAKKAFSILQTQEDLQAVIIDLSNVPHMDMTALVALEALLKELQKDSILVVLNNLHGGILRKLGQMGIHPHSNLAITSSLTQAALLVQERHQLLRDPRP